MPRRHQIYAEHGLFIGPSPASGAHWINSDGTFGDTTGDWNLLAPMNRVQSVSYSFNTNRPNIKQLGKYGTIYQGPIEPSTVNLDISYLQNGVFNEYMLGFTTNYTEISGANVNQPHYTDNSGVFLLSGFVTRTNNRNDNSIDWPYHWNDIRNIFIGVESEGDDINYNSQINSVPIHPQAQNIGVVAFGNCYLTRYNSQCQVGSFPIVTTSFVCENMATYTSGYACQIPALYPLSGTAIPRTFTLPFSYLGTALPSVVRPGDITIDIQSLIKRNNILAIQGTGTLNPGRPEIFDLGIDVRDIKIQGYSIDLTLPRRSLENLGYRLPIDREIVYPVFASISFNTIIGDLKTGSLTGLMNKDDDYNIGIKLRNPSDNKRQGYAVYYHAARAKFQGINYQNQIGGDATATCSFTVELDPQDFRDRGLYMSGILNVDANNTVFGLMG